MRPGWREGGANGPRLVALATRNMGMAELLLLLLQPLLQPQQAHCLWLIFCQGVTATNF
jgi:hypothetical protein